MRRYAQKMYTLITPQALTVVSQNRFNRTWEGRLTPSTARTARDSRAEGIPSDARLELFQR